MPAKIKEVQCKLCGAWVPVADLEKHIAEYHSGTPALTPQSVFGVK
jgi:hypothetical protein